jgi:hypothetical protein
LKESSWKMAVYLPDPARFIIAAQSRSENKSDINDAPVFTGPLGKRSFLVRDVSDLLFRPCVLWSVLLYKVTQR